MSLTLAFMWFLFGVTAIYAASIAVRYMYRAHIVLKWSGWFAAHGDTYQVDEDLAQFWPCLLSGRPYVVDMGNCLVRCLRDNGVSTRASIWRYFEFLDEDEGEEEEDGGDDDGGGEAILEAAAEPCEVVQLPRPGQLSMDELAAMSSLEIQKLGRFHMRLIASRIGIIGDEQKMVHFMAQDHAGMADVIWNTLQEWKQEARCIPLKK